jgi:small subunit ribosomal protein S4e
MARGPKKHLKRLNAPKKWMLDKLSGKFAPRPSAGPHKLRESMPLIVLIRNKLKYALTYNEAKKVTMSRAIKVDNKVRTDMCYPTGFQDVISIDKTSEHFRMLFDVKGRFLIHRVKKDEATFKLCRVKSVSTAAKGVPVLVTHDGRTIRYPDPLIKVNDSIKLDIATGKILDFIKFEPGNIAYITGGQNCGRIGIITNKERHPGSFDIVHVKDSVGHSFATRLSNVFPIGKGKQPWITLPRGKGVRLSIAEERDRKLAAKAKEM